MALDVMQPEPTMWEVVRRLDELNEGQKEIKNSLDTKYVRRDVYDAEEETKKNVAERQDARIKILEKRHDWMIRLLLGTLATSLAGLITALAQLKT